MQQAPSSAELKQELAPPADLGGAAKPQQGAPEAVKAEEKAVEEEPGGWSGWQ